MCIPAIHNYLEITTAPFTPDLPTLSAECFSVSPQYTRLLCCWAEDSSTQSTYRQLSRLTALINIPTVQWHCRLRVEHYFQHLIFPSQKASFLACGHECAPTALYRITEHQHDLLTGNHPRSSCWPFWFFVRTI